MLLLDLDVTAECPQCCRSVAGCDDDGCLAAHEDGRHTEPPPPPQEEEGCVYVMRVLVVLLAVWWRGINQALVYFDSTIRTRPKGTTHTHDPRTCDFGSSASCTRLFVARSRAPRASIPRSKNNNNKQKAMTTTTIPSQLQTHYQSFFCLCFLLCFSYSPPPLLPLLSHCSPLPPIIYVYSYNATNRE